MNDLIDGIFNWLVSSGVDVRAVIVIIALLPIAEARLAIPIALKCGLSPFESFLYGFLGSGIAVPFLLIALIPLIKRLAETKLFRKIGTSLLERFDSKAKGINKSSEIKKFLGTAAFVAVPLPLTGVWTGSAVASVLGMSYFKSLTAVILGNLLASTMVVIISAAFSEYINIIMAVFAFLAIVTALTMLIKALKPKKSA